MRFLSVLFQERVVFTGYYDATLFDFDQEETLPVTVNTTTNDLYTASSCINSGVIGCSIKDEEITDLQEPVQIL